MQIDCARTDRQSLTWLKRAGLTVATGCLALVTVACDQVVTEQYDATATVTYTWQANYVPAGPTQDRPNDTRIEKFESVSLVNQNGIRPGKGVTGPDDKGLWWPALPPKPTVDDLETRLQSGEQSEPPELIKSVDYALSFDNAGAQATMPANYEVYRQAVKAYPNQQSLQLTLGPNDASVVSAKIQ